MSYYYSNYITELSVQDLSKNLNENMKENRNFDHYNKLKDLKMDVIFEEDNFLGSFEKTIKQLEDKITICSDLTDDNNENLCNVDYKIFIKFENFDNFPDLTEIQIRKYNILKNEINLTKSNDQMDYVRRCLFNTQNYLRSSENALYENDEFYIKILEWMYINYPEELYLTENEFVFLSNQTCMLYALSYHNKNNIQLLLSR